MSNESLYEFNRRTFMKGVAGTAFATAIGTSAHAQEKPLTWRNWSGSVNCTVQASERPKNEGELVNLVHKANKENWGIRLAGSGHSFTPVCHTDGMTISMAEMSGITDIDSSGLRANVLGGTKMRHMHLPLREAGLAMENISDIDRQAIGGAMATATHGTGKGLRSISSQAVSFRLVTATGDTIECSREENPEIFRAAQVSLGALGIVSHVRMQFMKTYRLHEKSYINTFDEMFEALDDSIANNRHYEFFWVSQLDGCMNKALNITDDPVDSLPELGDASEGERTGFSDVIFPSIRNTRFNEIEYSVPEANGPDCLKELRELMKGKHKKVAWPLEYRTVGSEDSYLSMAAGRDTVTISAHQPAAAPLTGFFEDCEDIFRNHNGRPHWGKIHTMKAKELSALYPQWDNFQKVREQLDPKGLFMNDHLKEIFG